MSRPKTRGTPPWKRSITGRRGKHHEIYLSDMRRTAPAKLKTVVRQPVEKA